MSWEIAGRAGHEVYTSAETRKNPGGQTQARPGAARPAPNTQPQEPVGLFWSDSGRQHRTSAEQGSLLPPSSCKSCLPGRGESWCRQGGLQSCPGQLQALRKLQQVQADPHLTPNVRG